MRYVLVLSEFLFISPVQKNTVIPESRSQVDILIIYTGVGVTGGANVVICTLLT